MGVLALHPSYIITMVVAVRIAAEGLIRCSGISKLLTHEIYEKTRKGISS